MSHQADTLREAKRRGKKDITELNSQEYDEIRRDIRTREELIVDGAKMYKARLKDSLDWGQVSNERAAENLSMCRTNLCGSYAKLTDGTEVCNRCNCMGADLYRKCKQDNESCPADPPYWDNRTLLTIKATDARKPD